MTKLKKIREVEEELISLSEFFRQNGLDSIPNDDIIYLLEEDFGIEAEFDNVFCTCDVRDGKIVQTQRTGLGPGLVWKDKEGKNHYVCLVCLEGKNKLLDYLS